MNGRHQSLVARLLVLHLGWAVALSFVGVHCHHVDMPGDVHAAAPLYAVPDCGRHELPDQPAEAPVEHVLEALGAALGRVDAGTGNSDEVHATPVFAAFPAGGSVTNLRPSIFKARGAAGLPLLLASARPALPRAPPSASV